MNEKKENICAVIVTYNRKKLLMECLKALLNQTYALNAILIVDNASTDGTPELLKEKEFIDEIPKASDEPIELHKTFKNSILLSIFYIRLHENTGGAGGFHEGVKRGYEGGYDWLWLMDDDVMPDKYCLKNLLKVGVKEQEILIVTPAKVFKEGFIGGGTIYQNLKNPFWRKNIHFHVPLSDNKEEVVRDQLSKLPLIVELDDVPFEGPLIRRKCIDLAGLPNKDLFICRDDVDYSLRVKKYGKLVLVTNALIIRKLPLGKLGGYKLYYFYRNFLFTDRLYGQNILVRLYRPIFYFFLYIAKSLFTLSFRKIPVLIRAYIDGYNRKLRRRNNRH